MLLRLIYIKINKIAIDINLNIIRPFLLDILGRKEGASTNFSKIIDINSYDADSYYNRSVNYFLIFGNLLGKK